MPRTHHTSSPNSTGTPPRELPERPTTLAVSDAITHYRQIAELSRNELAYVLGQLGHPLTAEEIAAIENRTRAVTVDDLMALAYALETTPAVMLSHIPVDMPDPEAPLATGLPADLAPQELMSWIAGETSLDADTRRAWWKDRIADLEIRYAHIEEQTQGAYLELRERPDLAADDELRERIQVGEHDLNQTGLFLISAEKHLEDLRG